MKPVRHTDLAYVAGLVDGEGNLKANRYGPKRRGESLGRCYGNSLRVRFADGQTIHWLRESFGIGSVYPEIRGRYQTMWNWAVCAKQCAEVLRAILPYLRTKRRQAELILQLRERIETYKQPRDARGRGMPIEEGENVERLAIIEQIHRLNQPQPRRKSRAPVRVTWEFRRGGKSEGKGNRYSGKAVMWPKREAPRKITPEEVTLLDLATLCEAP